MKYHVDFLPGGWLPSYGVVLDTWAFMVGGDGQGILGRRVVDSPCVTVPCFELTSEGTDVGAAIRFFKASLEERVNRVVDEISRGVDGVEPFTEATRPNQLIVVVKVPPSFIQHGGTLFSASNKETGDIWHPDLWRMVCGILCCRREFPHGVNGFQLGTGVVRRKASAKNITKALFGDFAF